MSAEAEGGEAVEAKEPWRVRYNKGSPVGATHESGLSVERVVSSKRKTSRGLTTGGVEFQVTVGDARFTGKTPESAIEWADEQMAAMSAKAEARERGPAMTE